MDIGTAKPHPAERAEVRHHLIDLVDPDEEFTRLAVPGRGRVALDGIAERRGSGGAGRRHRSVLPGGGRRPRAARSLPGSARAELEAEPDTGVLHARLAQLDPVAAGPHGAHQPSAGGAGARGDHRQRSALLVLRPGPRGVPAPAASRGRARPRARRARPAHRGAGPRPAGRRLARGGASAGRRPGGLSVTAASGPRATASCSTTCTGGSTLDEAVETIVVRTRRFQRRQDRWFRRDPRITWVDGRAQCSSPPPSTAWRLTPVQPHQAPRPRQRLPRRPRRGQRPRA